MAKTEPFDLYSERYEAWFEKHSNLYQAELAAIREIWPPDAHSALEIGVGSGRFAVPLGIRTGVEPSEQMALKAEAQGIRVVHGVAEALPFNDSEFDSALMVTTICFVDDANTALHEAFRVLKPQGSLIVGFVDRASELGRQYSDPARATVFYRDATFFSAEELCRKLTAAGFHDLIARQTLIPAESTDLILPGYGKGAFVALRGTRF